MSYDYKLTILTPTYNRASNLGKLYLSLTEQTNCNFQWLILDDGSDDDTDAVVHGFSKDNIHIDYYKKTNGGKHTALNYAHPYIKGEWTCIVDSDDFLTNDAVDSILYYIDAYNSVDKVGVISFLRGADISSPFNKDFPDKPFVSNHINFRVNANRGGDCCEVVRTEILKEHPFPEFKGERFLGEGYLWNYTGFHYNTLYVNKVIYICEYLEGGLTKSGRSMRIACPLGGMANSQSFFEKVKERKVSLKVLIKEAMLYVCYGKFARYGFSRLVRNTNRPFLVALLYLPGFSLYKYWNLKYKEK